ncbi:SRPBCC domain-containing protein [Pedobacter rhizosphaerae]|uniref:Activator of Hsp90 ATPase homolog 1-like protein n=1 Tax=Pedobacter rhizosphaerae TaxID=390241 RepID=A0A1H9QDI2_9SPHI|nr:SRPBCC domain-containing protein [Pedobacter rhizosphaerae]SER57929.1 Activator of Hsp90 ATPase homolog 1-like protein [Pedobacter rhizosphaerae]
MEKITFTNEIDASVEKVWDTLFGTETYPQWTVVFTEGSAVETDWKKGSKALFTDGKGNGMVSEIAESIPNEFMSIKHLGELKDGKETFPEGWEASFENYELKEKAGKTELTVSMDTNKEWKEYFENVWPKAIEKIKEIAQGTRKYHVET